MPRKKFSCSKCKRSFSMAAHLARHMGAIHGVRKAKAAPKKFLPGAPKFTCPRCKRSFSMAAHLARHMGAIHGQRKVGAAPRGRGRPKARRVGRPSGAGARLGLRAMTIEQLSDVIDAARQELRQKIADITQSLG